MKINSMLHWMTVASCAVIVSACTKNFEDYNTNHNEATPGQAASVLPGSLFQQLQRTVILYRDGTGTLDSDYQVSYNLCADTWAGYNAPTLGDGRNTGSFYMTEGWVRSLWVNKYSKSMNAYSLLALSQEASPNAAVMAMADIMKVTSMHQVADAYGPAPYSQVGTSLTPDYDSLESIYRQMLDELDAAIDALENYIAVNPSARIFADYDLVYGGDPVAWVKFANSLRLRLAMRVVYADAALAREKAEKSLSDPYGFVETNAENAVVSGVDHHPIFEINVNFNDADTQMGASMDCYLNGYEDPRMFLIAKPASDGKFHGVRNGIHTDVWTDYKNASGKVSAPNATIYKIEWLNAAEVWFLRAEAALRGWNAGGTAKAFYEAGVKASFDEWGAAGAEAYLQNSTAKPAAFVDNVASNRANAPSSITIAYQESDDFETNLERIITQKWIALYPNGSEAWAEYRRTRYPGLVAPVNNDSDGVVDSRLQIRRMPYPISEQADNAAGLAVGLSLLGGPDNAGTKLWWDKKD